MGDALTPEPASRRKDTIPLQKAYISRLRSDLKDPDTFRKVYNFVFDYAKEEGQRSIRSSLYPPIKRAEPSTHIAI